MQVAKCAQRLQLPAAASSSITNADAQTNGSLDHLLGVTPQQLVQVQVPDIAAAQVCNHHSTASAGPAAVDFCE